MPTITKKWPLRGYPSTSPRESVLVEATRHAIAAMLQRPFEIEATRHIVQSHEYVDKGWGEYELHTKILHGEAPHRLEFTNIEFCTSDAAGPSVFGAKQAVSFTGHGCAITLGTSWSGYPPTAIADAEVTLEGDDEALLESALRTIEEGFANASRKA